MAKIDLSSINKKHVQPKNKIEKPPPQPKPPVKETAITTIPKVLKNKPVKKPIKEAVAEKPTTLSPLDRTKKIKLLELYVIEFPQQLEKYKSKDFNKCTDQQLIEYQDIFGKSVSSSNNLGMCVTASQQALFLYEQVGQLAGLNIAGISTLGQSEEWQKNVKALCLKYLDSGIITAAEPENRLAFMLFQNSLALHMMNSAAKNAPKRITQQDEFTQDAVPINQPAKPTSDLGKLNTEYADI